MPSIDARCTQCGGEAFGGTDDNNNYDTFDVRSSELRHGGGKTHGTEVLVCTACSEECGLDECKPDNPCENCSVATVHNRCGSSVPTAQR